MFQRIGMVHDLAVMPMVHIHPVLAALVVAEAALEAMREILEFEDPPVHTVDDRLTVSAAIRLPERGEPRHIVHGVTM
jgi:hypothetical protein